MTPDQERVKALEQSLAKLEPLARAYIDMNANTFPYSVCAALWADIREAQALLITRAKHDR